MVNRGTQKNKKSFDSLLFESIKQSLSILIDSLATKSFFTYLQTNYKIKKEKIGENLDVFSMELEKFFGVNALKIEKMIVALMFAKLGMAYEETEEFILADQISNARSRSIANNNFNRTKLPLDDNDLSVIKALREDARKTVTQIAKETGLSRPTVTNMIERLTKQNLLQIKAGLNIQELRFPTACLALECNMIDQRKDLIRKLSMCPRVLMILEPSEKVNMLVFLYGEDQATLKSTIESLRHFSEASIVDIYHSGPPTVQSAFNLPIFIEKSDSTPCGRTCGDCVSYLNNECIGCPAVNEYRGPL